MIHFALVLASRDPSMVWLIIPGIANCRGAYRMSIGAWSAYRSFPDHYLFTAHPQLTLSKKKGAGSINNPCSALIFLSTTGFTGADRRSKAIEGPCVSVPSIAARVAVRSWSIQGSRVTADHDGLLYPKDIVTGASGPLQSARYVGSLPELLRRPALPGPLGKPRLKHPPCPPHAEQAFGDTLTALPCRRGALAHDGRSTAGADRRPHPPPPRWRPALNGASKAQTIK